MKRLVIEFKYLINRMLFGILLIPGILWAATSLLGRYTGTGERLAVTDYYLQFYGTHENPVHWLWVAAPYLVFLLSRRRSKTRKVKQQAVSDWQYPRTVNSKAWSGVIAVSPGRAPRYMPGARTPA